MKPPIYAIGDIHGQIDMLHTALDLIHADGGADARVVFLGDYVDRGPDSRAVVQALIDGVGEGRNWVTLKGNHDRYLTRFLAEKTVNDSRTRPDLMWLNPILGGDKTLASYGVAARDGDPIDPIHGVALEAIPDAHLRFLTDLPLYYETDDHLFVHAGIRPGIALVNQAEDDLVWIRDSFLEDPRDYGRLIVHGHTALQAPQHFGNRVDLDGGAGYGRPIYPAVFEGLDCWLLTGLGRIPLTP